MRRDDNGKYILVCHGKYGDQYFDATGDQLFESARTYVLELDEIGWYPSAEDLFPEAIEGTPPYTQEEIDAISDLDIRKVMESKVARWRYQADGYKQALRHDKLLEIARDEDHPDNGKAAFQFMRERADHEYGGYEVVLLR